MLKKLCIFLLIVLCFNRLSAQRPIQSFFISKYADSGFNKKNPVFYLVQLSFTTPDTVKKKCQLLAVRKLSPSFFIIKSNPSFISFLEKQFVSVYNTNNRWKLSPMAEECAEKNKNTIFRYSIEISDLTFIQDVLNKHFPKAVFYSDQKIISIAASYSIIAKYFLEDNRVIHINASSKPAPELGTPGFDLSANNVNSVHNKYPTINGEGMHVSLKEDYYDTTDIDLKGRFDRSPLASQNITNHANFMATIIAGAGNSVYYATGVAREAHFSSSSFESILPDEMAYYDQNKITVQNHSYGTVIDNNYGLNATAFDRNANSNLFLLHVFSSGNTGNAASQSGKYAGIAGFANLTGSFKMAKNIITVGAADTFGNPAALSSRGPAYDGRIKPDITAFQKNGTSESAALVSGTTLLMQQLFLQKNINMLPSALARAVLINSADDVSNPGPDYYSGFGNLNAEKAMETIDAGKYFSGRVSNGNEEVFNVTVPSGLSALKISLAWNDTAALPDAPVALVNDLDLTVTDKITGKTWQPWVLSSDANPDSLSKNAVRKRDSLNNEEQVTVDHPSEGNYEMRVKGFNVATAAQQFYLAYNWDTLDSFSWEKFTATGFVKSNNDEIIRWETNMQGTGVIDYALTPFNHWKTITDKADLSAKYLYWNTPDTTSKVMVRVKAANRFYYSDTFLITTLAKPTTGFLCGDSLFIYWNKLKGVNEYQVYKLGEKYMEAFIKTKDTNAIISAAILNNHYLSVAPVLSDGTAGVKSYGFDYTAQNAGCFISSFYADTKDNAATLSLSLGTLYKVDSIYIQKYGTAGFEDIGTIAIHNLLNFQYSYQPLLKGVSFFRAKIVLSDGKIIYSDKIAVYYNEPGKYLVFPIPVKRNQSIEIFTPIPEEEVFTLADVSGRIVLKKQIQYVHEYIPATNLSPGMYFYRISKNDGTVSIGKVVVL
jgi:hypothetical protein